MIEPKEIRLGNYFHLIDKISIDGQSPIIPTNLIFEIVGLPWDHVQCKLVDQKLHEMENGPYTIDYKQASPIRLNENWLEMFGFEFNPRKKTPKQCLHDKFGCLYGKDGLWKTTFNEILVIKHVHQLQNLYFALTGKELELKENESR